ncbi:DUF6114 domain-containing protein [Embleya scabrispora]|uniref:DUF6114 domain-containing protein n=1 Tax=Embleya scabrispora TaxID=159449 RepID=UPI000369E52D|nr:DUF6114 domain-containing protein [Embleya scabrispora]MYS85240.1 ABC transporter permease [Streptomyces sp. SID5474]
MTAEQRQPSALGRGWQAFRRWRKERPFWAGLFTILGSGPILWAPYATLSAGDITFKITQMGGVSAIFIGAILILSGIAIWLNPKARVYIGIFVILVSLVSFVVATFGGFFVGMLFGLIGGTLAISWVFLPAEEEAGEDRSDEDDEGGTGGERVPQETLVEDGFLAQALNGKAPDASGEASTGSETDRPGDGAPGAVSPRLALATIATAMIGVVGVVGIAQASPSDELPSNPYADGPCVSASPTTSSSTSAPPSTASAPPSTAPGESVASTSVGKAGQPAAAAPSPAAETRAAELRSPQGRTPEPKLPELELPELKLPEVALPGLPGLGLPGNMLPSTASTAPAAAPSTLATNTQPASAASATPSGKAATRSATTSAKPSATLSSAKPTAGKTPFPCPIKGPVDAKAGSGEPPVAVDPFVLRSNLLAMAGLNYEGVVKVKTLQGTEEPALKFTVSKGIDIWNLSMTVKEASGRDVAITAREGSKSWMEADTKTTMYVKYLKGNIFGVVPITFTPDSPPPINVPVVFFTNVESAMYAQLGGRMHIPGYGINKDHLRQ